MMKNVFLALTPAELCAHRDYRGKAAWMACHFSPSAPGLNNLPAVLAPGSLLILDDSTPIHGHDPELIARQLKTAAEDLGCYGIVLDLQRAGNSETQALARHLAAVLSCPVAVSEPYAQDTGGAVFLPPIPVDMEPEAYFAPWMGREIWLEAALGGTVLTLTEAGCSSTPLDSGETPEKGRFDETLLCHYCIGADENSAQFTLWRTPEDLSRLLDRAEALGIQGAVGLYQELGGLGIIPDHSGAAE